MSTEEIKDLSKRNLVALLSNPSVKEQDYRHNAIVAIKCAAALSDAFSIFEKDQVTFLTVRHVS